MNEIADSEKAYYLSECELYVLIQSFQISEITIFKELLEQNPSAEEIGMAVTSMVRRGLLENGDENCFCMSDDLRNIMIVLKKAEWTAKLKGQKMSIPQQILYRYKDAVVCLQMDEMRAGYVRLAFLTLQEMVDQIMSYECLPQEEEGYEELDEEAYDPEQFPALRYEEEERVDSEEILLSIEISENREQSPDRNLFVYKLPLKDVILLTGGDTFRVLPYGRDNLINGIRELSHDFS